jgi:hypothetical protein
LFNKRYYAISNCSFLGGNNFREKQILFDLYLKWEMGLMKKIARIGRQSLLLRLHKSE